MIRVGLTGGIGSGKSTIAKILESRGYPVFYSDDAAKRIVIDDEHVKSQIVELLGEEAYDNGSYNREFVGKRVFANTDLLNQLNQIIHPAVRSAFDHFSTQQKSKLVFNEAAILFETGGDKAFDFNILVCSPLELRLKRLMIRDNASEAQIKARMNKQWDDERKRDLADFVIENNEKDSILIQIDQTLKKLNLLH